MDDFKIGDEVLIVGNGGYAVDKEDLKVYNSTPVTITKIERGIYGAGRDRFVCKDSTGTIGRILFMRYSDGAEFDKFYFGSNHIVPYVKKFNEED